MNKCKNRYNGLMHCYTLFISDLHLEEGAPTRTAAFFEFLENHKNKADALYILGDFFDVWVGDDEQSSFHQDIIVKLKEFSSQTPVYFMHGNHDFLIGKAFTKDSGVQLIPDPFNIKLYGKNIVLAHGDGLITEDKKHLRYRGLYQINFIKKLFLLLPLKFRKFIAKHLKSNSRSHLDPEKTLTFGVNTETVKNLLRESAAQTLIHGHVHLPDVHDVDLDGVNAKRVVLDSWYELGNYLQWEESGEKSLVWFRYNKS